MKTIIVDDECFAIEALEFTLGTMAEIELIGTFCQAEKALDFVKAAQPELAFLDIEMPGITGIELAHRLRELSPQTRIVFVTGFNNYAQQAFDVEACGYILKPFTEDKIRSAIERVKMMALPEKKEKPKAMEFSTFGRFDVFINGQTVVLRNKKARELLALCVDRRGGVVSMEEAIDKLWENRPFDEKTKKLYRKAVMDITHTLEAAGAPSVFKTRRGICYIERDEVACDYYSLLEGNPDAAALYNGAYLFEYDWAEERIAEIEELVALLKKDD